MIRKKLIEVALPLDEINTESAREKSIRHGHPSTLHLWWARRPLAACRAVLFAQLVDDPSSWPDRFPTEADQVRERERLFDIIRELVKWENVNKEAVLNRARLEIARSIARQLQTDADALGESVDIPVLMLEAPPPELVNDFLAKSAPPVLDPFAGGGSIPLEAQRLGLRAYASDLNPVAVLINKALIEIPPKFANRPPVNPESRKNIQTWKGAQGLAEDVRFYGEWMRREARQRIGHLYGEDPTQPEKESGKIIAWLWARTVPSPDPAFKGAPVPLVSGFWLSKKPGKETWLEPVVDKATGTWRLEIRKGKPIDPKAVDAGTKTGHGANFRCLLSGAQIGRDHVRESAESGKMGARLMAIVHEGKGQRIYRDATEEDSALAAGASPAWAPDFEFVKNTRHMTPCSYGMTTFASLFTPRQLVSMTTFSDLVIEARDLALEHSLSADMAGQAGGLEAGGTGAKAYADAVAVYLGIFLTRMSNLNNALCQWRPDAAKQHVGHMFSRQAIPMVWDYAEANPFGPSAGGWVKTFDFVPKVLDILMPSNYPGLVHNNNAMERPHQISLAVVSTDPPYYDNVPYADLSDFFYVWLRRSLRYTLPSTLSTILVPKVDELVAEPFRHGGKEQAEAFFMNGMTRAIQHIRELTPDNYPSTIYYAFKQSESAASGTSSTGWESFLAAVLESGFSVVGTWPMRTELANRMRSMGSNALATSVVLVCRKRPEDAPTTTRAEFRRLLKRELPQALRRLQHGNIAPVDLAQAAIGPGMAIFSRHSQVMEADGSPMWVRTALQIINQALDEYFSEQESELDGDSRFAVTWFSQHGLEAGPFGVADNLARSCNVSVQGIAESGILHASAGKVRLMKRSELKADWDPASDARLGVWEATQHLIKRLEDRGEEAAASLITPLGSLASRARDLAYRLFAVCERKGWSEEALAYNTLVVAWPEITKLAEQVGKQRSVGQQQLF